jgi:uncharacterized membrane protein (DUF2068 family)
MATAMRPSRRCSRSWASSWRSSAWWQSSVGAWRLKGWAWWLGLILSALYALASLSGVSTARNAASSLTAPLVQLVIGVVVFVYLLTPGVRRAFGR